MSHNEYLTRVRLHSAVLETVYDHGYANYPALAQELMEATQLLDLWCTSWGPLPKKWVPKDSHADRTGRRIPMTASRVLRHALERAEMVLLLADNDPNEEQPHPAMIDLAKSVQTLDSWLAAGKQLPDPWRGLG